RVRGVAPPARRARGRGRRRRGIRGAVLLAGVLGTPLGVGRAGRRTRPGVGRPGGDTRRRRRAWLARPGRQRRRDLPQHPPVVGPQFHDRELGWGPLEHVVGNAYLIWAAVFLVVLGVRASRLGPPDRGADPLRPALFVRDRTQ